MILYNLLTIMAQGVTVDPDDNRLNNIPNVDIVRNGSNGSVDTLLQIVFGFGGAIALIILVLAGLRYVTSMGDPQKTAQAKNSIIYAAIGLAVCATAFSIVRFVIGEV